VFPLSLETVHSKVRHRDWNVTMASPEESKRQEKQNQKQEQQELNAAAHAACCR
jgi:hypothetical protein